MYGVTLDETEAIRQLKPGRRFGHVQEHKTSVTVCVEHISEWVGACRRYAFLVGRSLCVELKWTLATGIWKALNES